MIDHRVFHAEILPNASALMASALNAEKKIAKDREKEAAEIGKAFYDDCLEKAAKEGYSPQQVDTLVEVISGREKNAQGFWSTLGTGLKTLFGGPVKAMKTMPKGVSAMDVMKMTPGKVLKPTAKSFVHAGKGRLAAAAPHFQKLYQEHFWPTLGLGAGTGILASKMLGGGGEDRDLDVYKF